jgi:uncharacterized membrane protein
MARAAGIAWKALVVAGIVVSPLLVHVGVDRGALEPAGAALAGVPHAAIYAYLLWIFGRTLRRGTEPLITRLARQVRGGLSPAMERYTRRLTAAWCVFFAGQLAASALLFALAPFVAWSLFINVLNLPLVALMFAGDYLYRVLRCRGDPQSSIAAQIRAFARDRASRPLAR